MINFQFRHFTLKLFYGKPGFDIFLQENLHKSDTLINWKYKPDLN